MLKTNHTNLKRYKIPLISSAIAVGGMFLFSYLTFIPKQVFAEYDWETRTLSDINTMQQMNAKICENSEIEEETILEDTRDHKKYYVAKLKGDAVGTKEKGECWMTQNLAYSGTDKDEVGISCTLSSTENDAHCYSGSWLNDIKEKYFAIGKHKNGVHESQGNYYNWPAAVQNGSGGDEIQGVCPDKWQLPTSGNDNSKSFGNLINAYNISVDTNYSKLTGNPLHFQYSGNINSGTTGSVGIGGYYWSSTTSSADNAHHLAFSSNYIYPSFNAHRAAGFPIRCVAANIYPDEPVLDDNQANVAITVSPVISIDVTKDANDMAVDFTKVATSTIIARVGSNQPYQLLLSTDKSDLTNPKTDQTIPMIPSEQTIVKGTNSWGIKKLSSPTDTTVNESTTYSPVGINGNKELFYTSTSAASEDLTFPVAIAVDSSLPSGQYSTQVTLTAVAM